MNADRQSSNPLPADGVRFLRSPSGEFRLEAVQFFPQSRERMFSCFADAFQLEAITPPWLHFAVLTPAPMTVNAGTLIDYRLRLRGIPIRWQSRISVWEPPHRFVDEQMRGPYRRWHHEHILVEAPGGTVCRDVVDYAVAGGRVIDALILRPELRRIFVYRQQKLRELLGS